MSNGRSGRSLAISVRSAGVSRERQHRAGWRYQMAWCRVPVAHGLPAISRCRGSMDTAQDDFTCFGAEYVFRRAWRADEVTTHKTCAGWQRRP